MEIVPSSLWFVKKKKTYLFLIWLLLKYQVFLMLFNTSSPFNLWKPDISVVYWGCCFLFFHIEVLLIYSIVSFKIIFHYRLLQSVRYNSLCYSGSPSCLSTLMCSSLFIPNIIKKINASSCVLYTFVHTQKYYSAIEKQMKFCHLQQCGWT